MALWINAISFQLAWWMLVVFQERWAFPVLVAFLLIHFFWVLPRVSPHAKGVGYWLWLALIFSFGIGSDLVFFQTGLLSSPLGFPVWLVCLWVCFVLSLPVCMRWFLARPMWGIPALTIGGPLTYLGGMQFATIVPAQGIGFWLLASGLVWLVLAGVSVFGYARVTSQF